MRLTLRQRAQVVELLRCAADVCVANWDDTVMIYGRVAADGLDVEPYGVVAQSAYDALVFLSGGRSEARTKPEFVWLCLEAAARVEEGSWP